MKKQPIATWADLFERIGREVPLMHILGVSKQNAFDMRKRCVIPSSHWTNLVAWAAENDKPEITFDLLGRLAAKHPSRVAAE